MRLLVTGVAGLLGMNTALGVGRRVTVTGVHRGSLSSAPFRLLQTDLTDADACERALLESQAEVVFHCAAMADVDACESDPAAARLVNTQLPFRMARACKSAGVRLIHISTDAVFDGSNEEPYTEHDWPKPVSVYAETKLNGEMETLSVFPEAIVARVNFYGWSPSGTRSLAEFFHERLSTGKQSRGFQDVVFCPMLVTDLVDILLEMDGRRFHGLYHAVGPEPMSKYEFGIAIARAFGFDGGLITRDSVANANLAATRGRNLNLSVHKLSTALGHPMPEFSTGLSKFHRQMLEGYPQRIQSYRHAAPVAAGPQPNTARRVEVGRE